MALPSSSPARTVFGWTPWAVPAASPTPQLQPRDARGTRAGNGAGGRSQQSWFGVRDSGFGVRDPVLLFASLQGGGTSTRIQPTAKGAAAVRGVPCVPEERGTALLHPELGRPQLRCDAPSRAGRMVAPGQSPGADPAEERGRQVEQQLRAGASRSALDHQNLPRCRSLRGSLSQSWWVWQPKCG